MNKLRIVSAFVILLLGSVALGQYMKSRGDNKTYPARDHIIHQIETRHWPDGSQKSFGFITSWVKSSGEIKTVAVRFKGDTPIVSYGLGNGDGQFHYRAGEGSIHLSTSHNDPARDNRRSTQYHLTSPQFDRTETILGFTTYVMKSQSQGQTSFEVYFAPEVGPSPIKTVQFIRNKNKELIEKLVLEPVKIEFSPLPQEMFATPNMPIDFSAIEQEIEDAENEGNHAAAENLKKLVANLKRDRQR